MTSRPVRIDSSRLRSLSTTMALALACAASLSSLSTPARGATMRAQPDAPATPFAPMDRSERPEPISYTVRFSDPAHHTFEVEARFPLGPAAGGKAVELMLPVWTPGSYLVREPARNLDDVHASSPDGVPLAVEKTAKNRWSVASGGAREIVVRYRVYARELTVRTNFVDSAFALINGSGTYLTLASPPGTERRPYRVTVVPRPEWKSYVSPLTGSTTPAGDGLQFEAADYDELLDSPLYAGNADLRHFQVGGKDHILLSEGGERVWDNAAAAADAERIVGAVAAFWGVVPYPRYVFYNLLAEGGGGIEHKGSSVLMANRFGPRTRKGRIDWTALVCHELFHAWNVKRLRPAALGPFDYEHENYTHDLWVAEGFTDYYGDLLVRRADLASRKEYLKELSETIEGVQTTPGRERQRLSDASFDAWIKLYRRDENSNNSAISYYTKGSLVAFLLDARIRKLTAGQKSLDDAMRLAYQRFSGPHGYDSEAFRRAVSEVAGSDLTSWFARAVDSTEELSYDEALEWYGLRFAESGDDKGDEKNDDKGDKEKDDGTLRPKPAWLGAAVDDAKGLLLVTEVKRGTPAFDAGLNVGDEILALGDYRIPPDGLDNRLKAYRPGDREELLVVRRGRLVRLPVVLGEKPKARWKLEVAPTATSEQKAHLEAWLGPEGKPASDKPAAVTTTAQEQPVGMRF